MIIDIRTNINNPGLYARKIWEALFREVKAWEWPTLDSFLCDLKIFETAIGKKYNQFYWESHPSGYTETYLDERYIGTSLLDCRIFRITIKPNDKITIEEV